MYNRCKHGRSDEGEKYGPPPTCRERTPGLQSARSDRPEPASELLTMSRPDPLRYRGQA